MNSDQVIHAEGLSKRYRAFRKPGHRVLHWCRLGHLAPPREIWALRDIGFTVTAGESVALVGENGAGKSTLLALLLGTTRPTTGHFAVRGEAAALLELGLGMQPDFTGRQNARLALQMRGRALTRREEDRLIAAINAFAELGDAFDRPLRTYSTGMQMRLAFGCATVERPEILIVDEALAVGDAHFQYKCIERIKQYRRAGTTLLFVSHDLAALRTLCDRGLLLAEGRLVADDAIEPVLDRYNALLADRHGPALVQQDAAAQHGRTRAGNGAARITHHALHNAQGQETGMATSGDAARLVLEVTAHEAIEDLTVGLLIRDRLGLDIFGTNTAIAGTPIPSLAPGQAVRVTLDLTLALGPGMYFITLAAHAGDSHLAGSYDWIDNAMTLQILPRTDGQTMGAAALPARFAVAPPGP